MTIDEALDALSELDRGPTTREQTFGPQNWVDKYMAGDDAFRMKSNEVAWTLVHDGTPRDRQYALEFWAVVSPPQGVSDALAELYLSENPSDPNLRASVGRYSGHQFSEDVGRRLAARFAADPDGELDLAGNAVRYDPQGAAWDALIRMVLKTDDATRLFALFDAAYLANRVDDFFTALKGKPDAVLREIAGTVPLRMRARFLQITGIAFP